MDGSVRNIFHVDPLPPCCPRGVHVNAVHSCAVRVAMRDAMRSI